jgi:hypothetical protein
MDQHLRKQERPILNAVAATGLVEFMNEKPFEHTGHYGTTLRADRCDFVGGAKITTPEGNTEAQFASDMMEIGAWHAIHIHPRLNGFQGYDCLDIVPEKES